jgi:hypothetical protein
MSPALLLSNCLPVSRTPSFTPCSTRACVGSDEGAQALIFAKLNVELLVEARKFSKVGTHSKKNSKK